jgi:serine O-acetyltransferase
MLMAAVEIGAPVSIGPGLLIAHGNVIIDGEVTIGSGCQLSPFVTIGLDTGGPDPRFCGPTIGDNVFLGTGAKVLGPVTIGDDARIGANAVVMCDVPANSTAVGIPARIVPHQPKTAPTTRQAS